MNWFETVLLIWIIIPFILFPILLKIRVPYGRHTKTGWGPMTDNHWSWFWMEVPALLLFPLLVILGPQEKDLLSWILVLLWIFHYFHRTLIFPFKIRTKGKKMPVFIMVSGIFFNLVNGFLNGYYLGFINGQSGSLFNVFAIAGIILFFTGYAINIRSDNKLIALRNEGNGYQIPRGWLFEYISCPNHFGEIIEWAGFALAARNLPALSFAIWTFCNLGPRASNHHEWYKEYFPAYPTGRKRVIPFVW